MPYAPATRTHADDTLVALRQAAAIVDLSGAVHLINTGHLRRPNPTPTTDPTHNDSDSTTDDDCTETDHTPRPNLTVVKPEQTDPEDTDPEDTDHTKVERPDEDDCTHPDCLTAANNTPTPARNRGGRTAYLPPYTTRTLLIAILELAWRGDTMSWTRIAHALWYRYQTDEMTAIGLDGWRDPARANTMRPAAAISGPTATNDTAHRTWKAEVNRLQAAADTLLARIDDTALPANKRQNINEFEAVTDQPDNVEARDLQRVAINRLVWASLAYANRAHYPELAPDDIHAGLLRHHKGDVGIDEHNLTVALVQNSRANTKPVKQLAAIAGKVRREGMSQAIGLTAAIAVSRPDAYRVPTIALAIDLHAPASGASAGSRNVLNTISQNALRPALASTAHQYVIVDKAYPAYKHWNEFLLANKYTMLGKFKDPSEDKDGNRRGLPFHDLAPRASRGEPQTTGPYLFNGVPVCPGIGTRTLHEHAHFDIPPETAWTTEWIRSHNPTEKRLKSAVMPTNGRPKQVKATKPGRPRRDAPPIKPSWSIEVSCPAAVENPKVRCPLREESLTLSVYDYPTMREHPKENDPKPRCCTDGFMRVTLDTRAVKDLQTKMQGSWEHQDLYSPARTATEAYFGRLMDSDTGDFAHGKIEWAKNAPVALAVASTIVTTNLRAIAKWQEVVAGNEGRPPRGTGAQRRERRTRLIALDATNKNK